MLYPKVSYEGFDLAALASMLGGTFAGVKGFEGYSVTETSSSVLGAFNAAIYQDDADNTRPYAYLNYIVYDNTMAYQDAGWVQVSADAGFEPGGEGAPNERLHKRLAFSAPVEINQDGYIYIWVSNQGEATKVWFDDLKVKHTKHLVVQATDYGVWGEVMREQKSDETAYLFGYQGQFAEKDEETGWNHFEAREYDQIIGRWTSKDPSKQFWSPYLGVGNNPVNGIDPDGKWFWEKSYIRQARKVSRHIGGELILDKDIGLASVDISGTSLGQRMGGHLLQFRDGEYKYELMDAIGIDFSDAHLSMISGWDYVKWFAEIRDQYARGEGKYDRNGQAPDWAKALAGLNAPVSVGDGLKVWFTGENIYHEKATSNFDKVQATVGVVAPFATGYIKGTTTILNVTVKNSHLADGAVVVHGVLDDFGVYDGLRKD